MQTNKTLGVMAAIAKVSRAVFLAESKTEEPGLKGEKKKDLAIELIETETVAVKEDKNEWWTEKEFYEGIIDLIVAVTNAFVKKDISKVFDIVNIIKKIYEIVKS